MYYVQLIFRACSKILSYHMNLLGYSVSLLEVMIYGFLVFIVGKFIFNMLN